MPIIIDIPGEMYITSKGLYLVPDFETDIERLKHTGLKTVTKKKIQQDWRHLGPVNKSSERSVRDF